MIKFSIVLLFLSINALDFGKQKDIGIDKEKPTVQVKVAGLMRLLWIHLNFRRKKQDY